MTRRRIYFPADEAQPRVNDAVIALIAIGCAAWAISFGWCVWSEASPEPPRVQGEARLEGRSDRSAGWFGPLEDER